MLQKHEQEDDIQKLELYLEEQYSETNTQMVREAKNCPWRRRLFLLVLSHTVTDKGGPSVLVSWFVTMEKFLREWLYCDSVILSQ